MLNITVDLFNEAIDLRELASLSYDIKKKVGILHKMDNFDDIYQELEELRKKYRFFLFRAYCESLLTGFLLLLVNTPKFGISWDWHPLVLPSTKENYIADELIKKIIEFSKKEDINRLEVGFTIENKVHESLFLKQVNWYQKQGFYKLAEEATLELLLDNYKLEPITLPHNYEVKTLDQVNRKKLPQIAYEAFDNSEDLMFLNLGEEEKKIMCKKYFDLSEPILEDASYILFLEKNIIGFSIIKAHNDETILNSIGIIPKYRNKGLTKLLLLYSLNRLKEKGVKKTLLDVTIENTSAYNLYSGIGFKKSFSTIIYAYIC